MTKARILADYVAGGTTATEFDYMDGVTSNVQTQLTAKAPLASPAFTGTPTGITGTHITSGTLGNTVQDNITRLGTVATGNLSNTAIVMPTLSNVKQLNINWTGDVSSTSTTTTLWNGTTSLLNMVLLKANTTIWFVANSSESFIVQGGNYFKLFMCAKTGSGSLASTPSGHTESNYSMIYARTSYYSQMFTICGKMTLSNSAGDTFCFSPGMKRHVGADPFYINYVGNNGEGSFLIGELQSN